MNKQLVEKKGNLVIVKLRPVFTETAVVVVQKK